MNDRPSTYDENRMRPHMDFSAEKELGKVVRLFDGMEVALNLPLQRHAVGTVTDVYWGQCPDGSIWPVFTVAFESMSVELREFEIDWGGA